MYNKSEMKSGNQNKNGMNQKKLRIFNKEVSDKKKADDGLAELRNKVNADAKK